MLEARDNGARGFHLCTHTQLDQLPQLPVDSVQLLALCVWGGKQQNKRLQKKNELTEERKRIILLPCLVYF